MVFIITWLKDDKEVGRQAMLDANSDDVLKVATELTPKIIFDAGVEPDTIRIFDASRNTTSLLEIGSKSA